MVCLLQSLPHTVAVEIQIFHQEEEVKKPTFSQTSARRVIIIVIITASLIDKVKGGDEGEGSEDGGMGEREGDGVVEEVREVRR